MKSAAAKDLQRQGEGMGKALQIGLVGLWLSGCTAGYVPYHYTNLAPVSTGPHEESTGYLTTPEEYQRNIQAAATAPKPSFLTSSAGSSVIVTAGPISQPYSALGEVNVNTVGMINLGSILNDALFRSPFQRAVQGPTPTAHTETLNEMLRTQARQQYGSHVDAVVNVTYRTDPDGDVFASGLAVRFIEPQPVATPATPGPTLEQKLTELKNLREKNLITPEEYYEKRNELLKGL